MIQLDSTHFEKVCGAAEVCGPIERIEDERRAAVRKFFIRGAIGLALAAAAVMTLMNAGWETVAIIVGIGFLIATVIAALAPLSAALEGLKHPTLDAIAAQCGMEYFPDGFDPPAFGSAAALLFGGGGFSSTTFTDLLNGTDADGRGEAVYEACLQRRSGKNSYAVFSGQMYAIQRRPGRTGHLAIVPDRKLLNFWKPASDMARIRIENDPQFEKKFEIYATDEMEARQLAGDAAFRARLLELRQGGRIFVYAGPDEALIAVTGKNRFEPGSMFRSREGRERVRLIFDDVAESLRLLGELKAKLG